MNSMGKILNFPPRPQKQSCAFNGVDDIQPVNEKRESIKRVLIWLWRIARWPLFLLFYWLRVPILTVLNLISAPTMLFFLVGLYALPEHRAAVWGVGCVSLAAFTVRHGYDFFLLKLSPDISMY